MARLSASTLTVRIATASHGRGERLRESLDDCRAGDGDDGWPFP
jgi:hypothetical protein